MKDPSVAQSIVFVVDDGAAIREALESIFRVGRIAGRAIITCKICEAL